MQGHGVNIAVLPSYIARYGPSQRLSLPERRVKPIRFTSAIVFTLAHGVKRKGTRSSVVYTWSVRREMMKKGGLWSITSTLVQILESSSGEQWVRERFPGRRLQIGFYMLNEPIERRDFLFLPRKTFKVLSLVPGPTQTGRWAARAERHGGPDSRPTKCLLFFSHPNRQTGTAQAPALGAGLGVGACLWG
jgi:hypothetical protein